MDAVSLSSKEERWKKVKREKEKGKEIPECCTQYAIRPMQCDLKNLRLSAFTPWDRQSIFSQGKSAVDENDYSNWPIRAVILRRTPYGAAEAGSRNVMDLVDSHFRGNDK